MATAPASATVSAGKPGPFWGQIGVLLLIMLVCVFSEVVTIQ